MKKAAVLVFGENVNPLGEQRLMLAASFLLETTILKYWHQIAQRCI